MTIVALLGGCSSTETPVRDGRTAHHGIRGGSSPQDTNRPVLDAAAGTVGPFIEPHSEGWTAIWAAPEEEGPTWFSRRVGSDYRFGEARRLIRAPRELGLVRIRSVEEGVLVVFSARRQQGHSLHTMLVGPAGELKSPPAAVVEAGDEIVWLDAVRAGSGTVLAWAERAGDRATVKTAARSADGSVSSIQKINETARGWQLVGTPGGAAMVTVDIKGHVELHALAASGEQLASHQVSDAAISGAVDVVTTTDGLVVAFETRPRLDARVTTALADFEGRVLTQPVIASEPLGEQALVRFVPGPVPLLVWQNLHREPNKLRAARLSKDGTAQGHELLVPVEAGLPDPLFTSADDGWAVLLWACPGLDGCDEPRPELVHLGADLQPRSLHPWLIDGGEDLAWNPTCRGGRCVGLVARYDTRSKVFVRTDAGDGAEDWALPVWIEAGDSPQALSLETAFETPELSALAATPLGNGQLVTTLTYFDPSIPYVIPDSPAPDGRLKPIRARLETRWLPPDWRQQADLPPAEVISYRARSTAGVSVAAKADQALVAWTAIDESEPQVFTTLLDHSGRRTAQKMQTRTRGEVHQVRVEATRTGWMLAWIDERSGRPQSYIARLLSNLGRSSPDTLAPLPEEADVVGMATAAAGNSVWLLQATRSPATVSVMRLDGNSVRPAEAPLPLGERAAADGAEVREPVLLWTPEQAWATWVSSLQGTDRIVVQRLDLAGRPDAPPVHLDVPGSVGRLTGSCDDQCRIVATVLGQTSASLMGARLRVDDSTALVDLAPLTSNVATSVTPAIRGDGIWFHDGSETLSRSGVHHADVHWP